MSTIEKPKPFTLSRIDQNLAKYPYLVEKNFGYDANLVLSILSFINAKFKNNLFNSCTFTLKEFCSKYNYHKDNLTKPHPLFSKKNLQEMELFTKQNKFRQDIEPYKSEFHEWKSEFDHVLIRMMKENILFSDKEKNARHLDALRSLQILKSVKIVNEQTRSGRKEFIYEVVLGDELFLNMFRAYISYKEESFITLGKSKNGIGRRNLYLYLLSQYQRCLLSAIPTNEVNPNYTALCITARLKNKQGRNNKQQLIKILDEIGSKEHLDFSHNLATVNLDNLRNEKIAIRFNAVHYFESKVSSRFFDTCTKMLQDYFHATHIKKSFDKTANDTIELFQLWLNDNTRDFDTKCNLVAEAYFNVTIGVKIDPSKIASYIRNNSWGDLVASLTVPLPPIKS